MIDERTEAPANTVPRFYSLTELEPILGVVHRTLLRYVTNGSLKAAKIGGRWKVTEEDLQAFINRKTNYDNQTQNP